MENRIKIKENRVVELKKQLQNVNQDWNQALKQFNDLKNELELFESDKDCRDEQFVEDPSESTNNNKFTPPSIEQGKKLYSEEDLIAIIRQNCINKINSLRSRYPSGSYITIGQTSNPKARDANYNFRAAVYKRSEATPPIGLDEQILFCTGSHLTALTMEYLLQFHLGCSDGMFYDQNSIFMNKQKLTKHKEGWITGSNHYVYVKFTKIPFKWTKLTTHDPKRKSVKPLLNK
jgi:hypothetical protein